MEDKQKVIFIEDDPNLGLIIVLALQSKGYEVCYANTLSGIQDMIEKDYPNILLLDLEVGNQNALDYLPFIRSKHPSLPVLIASSHNEWGGNNTLLMKPELIITPKNRMIYKK